MAPTTNDPYVSVSDDVELPPSYAGPSSATNTGSAHYDPSPLLRHVKTLRTLHLLITPTLTLAVVILLTIGVYLTATSHNEDAYLFAFIVFVVIVVPVAIGLGAAWVSSAKRAYKLVCLKRRIERKINRSEDPEEAAQDDAVSWRQLEDAADELVWIGI